MTSELQRDIDVVDSLVRQLNGWGLSSEESSAWQRIRARLAEQGPAVASIASSPDREEVAWRLFKAHTLCGETKGGRAAFEEHKLMWLRQADAAIAAMGETP